MKDSSSNAGINFPLLASNAFDISLFESFFPLLSGGTAVMLDDEQIKNIYNLAEQLKDVDAFHAVPALMGQVTKYIIETGTQDQYSGIKDLFIGGDKVPSSVLEEMRSVFPSARIHTLYGPTESTIFVTTNEYVNKEKDVFKGSIIGKPNQDIQIFILDAQQQLVPVGLIGEICIGGKGVARGYLNREELTEERFINNPYKANGRLYKTGDLGRWLPDGSIEFVGRKDDQVKVRGYRIELGEIEHTLQKHEEINQTLILVKENGSGEKELVAYFASETQQDISELRVFLRKFLPNYMIPNHFVQLEEFPVNVNGKIDRKLLPDPTDLGLSGSVEYVAPTNELEEQLVKIWEGVLHRENIGILDDFFELGMNSIQAIRIVSLIHQKTNIELKINDILENTNILELGKKMDSIREIHKMQQERKTATFKNKIEI